MAGERVGDIAARAAPDTPEVATVADMMASGPSEAQIGPKRGALERAGDRCRDHGGKSFRMTELVSRAAPGARIVATVTWYDVAKGYGFLTPGGGLPDIFCHVSALQDVGLDTLLQGATVTCGG